MRVFLVSPPTQVRELRETLSFVDLILADVLRRRAFLVSEIVRLKRENSIAVRDPDQESVVVRRMLEVDAGYPPEVVQEVYRILMEASEKL